MAGEGWERIARTVARKVCLVYLVYLVYLVCFVCLVDLVRLPIGPKKPERFLHCHFHIPLYVRSKAIKWRRLSWAD